MWKTFNNGGQEGTYWAEGEGKAVILIHGYGEDQSVWEHQTAFLRVHSPRTGAGPSGHRQVSHHPSPFHGQQGGGGGGGGGWGEFIYGMMTAEGISQATVIGHSMEDTWRWPLPKNTRTCWKAWACSAPPPGRTVKRKKKPAGNPSACSTQYGAEQFLRQLLPNMFAASLQDQPGREGGQFHPTGH